MLRFSRNIINISLSVVFMFNKIYSAKWNVCELEYNRKKT